MLGSEVRKSFKIVGALPFVPPEDVEMAWRHLKPLIPADMAAFVGYMERTWLGTSSNEPLLTSSDGISGMLQSVESVDFLDPPTSRKGGTTDSRAS